MRSTSFGEVIAVTDVSQEIECLDGPDECRGAVEYRMALSASGRSFPRCERHWSERLATQERLDRDYPDSDIPPAWFDPTAAGERWDDEA
jgi:hypothetical protein